MKYVLVLPDGAADEPSSRLDGKTPLEVAKKPNMDWIACNGRQGQVVTVPSGYTPGSDVATLSLLGYAPDTYYDGRAPLEAAAKGIEARQDQLIFRCNLVTIVDGAMVDFTAGHIGQAEAQRLMNDLNAELGGDKCTFHAGMSYRNLLIASDVEGVTPECIPPHDFPDQPVADHMPTGPGADWVVDMMNRAREVLARHEVNQVRRDLGENPATDIWLWGQGRPRTYPSFESRFGVKVATIAAVDLIRGISKCAGATVLDVPGATGYLDTDYAAKGKAAVEALSDYDFVIVHVEAPDEAGHLGDPQEKIKAIEQVDEHVVGPLLTALRRRSSWRILVSADHPTPIDIRTHTATPPPFCLAGEKIHPVLGLPYTEANACKSDLHIDPGHELMEFFLKH